MDSNRAITTTDTTETVEPMPKYQPKRIPWSELNPNERLVQLLVIFTVYIAIPAIGIIGILTVGRALHNP